MRNVACFQVMGLTLEDPEVIGPTVYAEVAKTLWHLSWEMLHQIA